MGVNYTSFFQQGVNNTKKVKKPCLRRSSLLLMLYHNCYWPLSHVIAVIKCIQYGVLVVIFSVHYCVVILDYGNDG